MQTRRIEQGERDLGLLLRQFARQRTLDLTAAEVHDRPGPLDSIRHAASTSSRISGHAGRRALEASAVLVRRGDRPDGPESETAAELENRAELRTAAECEFETTGEDASVPERETTTDGDR